MNTDDSYKGEVPRAPGEAAARHHPRQTHAGRDTQTHVTPPPPPLPGWSAPAVRHDWPAASRPRLPLTHPQPPHPRTLTEHLSPWRTASLRRARQDARRWTGRLPCEPSPSATRHGQTAGCDTRQPEEQTGPQAPACLAGFGVFVCVTYCEVFTLWFNVWIDGRLCCSALSTLLPPSLNVKCETNKLPTPGFSEHMSS